MCSDKVMDKVSASFTCKLTMNPRRKYYLRIVPGRIPDDRNMFGYEPGGRMLCNTTDVDNVDDDDSSDSDYICDSSDNTTGSESDEDDNDSTSDASDASMNP